MRTMTMRLSPTRKEIMDFKEQKYTIEEALNKSNEEKIAKAIQDMLKKDTEECIEADKSKKRKKRKEAQ